MLSIITITKNNFKDLTLTVNSYFQHPQIEYIVIDGGQCEQTKEFCKKKIRTTHFSYYNQNDSGISEAFNNGIKYSIGDCILFLNSGDELIDHHYLLQAIHRLENNTDIQIIHSNCLYNDKYVGTQFFPPKLCSPGRGMPYNHQTLIARRIIFEKIGNFKLSYKIAMDFEWICRFINFFGTQQVIYLKEYTPIRMDGGGVSQTLEFKSICESYFAIYNNKLMNLKNLKEYTKRVLFFLIRFILVKLRLTMLLKRVKLYRFKKVNNKGQNY